MKYITLLRGINVSGQKKVKMADLRTMCETMGYQNVQTYIQSGNIVFEGAEEDTDWIAQSMHQKIQTTFGYDVSVMVRTEDYWKEVAVNNPFLEANPDLEIKFLHVTFLAEVPTVDSIKALQEVAAGTDELAIINNRVYLYTPNGYGRTKLSNTTIEKKLQVSATTRNWRTVSKLLEM
ncbi:DUF1697 domain-containing protein [Aureispira anguillae]|uniref:DUF1697 domain-containing protein n=1 Tax=Aureispira anguillae TaxID=2864201 RepID=A0A916DVI6_9BACT|nr:DUF1697 domain-containing protein [Aureispira anguillae]BDS13767.1 DUF1697 domain-containing protein [Aureispira anguillae]